jgi:hypothetical protein
MLGCQRPLVRSDARAVPRTQPSAHGCPRAVTLAGDCGETSIPARSARTPLVVGPGRRRVETRRCQAPLPSGSSAFDDPTKGRVTRASAKKNEIRRTRGAFDP